MRIKCKTNRSTFKWVCRLKFSLINHLTWCSPDHWNGLTWWWDKSDLGRRLASLLDLGMARRQARKPDRLGFIRKTLRNLVSSLKNNTFFLCRSYVMQTYKRKEEKMPHWRWWIFANFCLMQWCLQKGSFDFVRVHIKEMITNWQKLWRDLIFYFKDRQ